MNIFKYILVMTVAIAMSCGSIVQAQTKNDSNMKTVVVYFTHSGNTELAAKQVVEVTGARMIRLLPEQPYSSEDVNWVNEQSRCTQEHLNQSLRPGLLSLSILTSQWWIPCSSVFPSGGTKNRLLSGLFLIIIANN